MEYCPHNEECPQQLVHAGETADGVIVITCVEPSVECNYKFILSGKEAQEFSDKVFA